VQGLAISLVLGPEYNRMESIERYLRPSFARVAIKGLEARFKGAAKGKGVRKKYPFTVVGFRFPVFQITERNTRADLIP
jgi:hypothetical protein